MKKKYFKLQLKSMFKIYPTILIITILTFASIAATCILLLKNNAEADNKHKISLSIVGDIEGTYLDIGLHALKNIDSSRFYIDINESNEQDAIKALKKREISGYVYIPNNYIESIYSGKNTPAKYVTLNTPVGFGTIISDEIAMLISHVVTESQNGMYSMQDLARDYNRKNLNQNIDKLMLSYVTHIINRNNMYNLTTVGAADSLSYTGYYICGILIIFMLLWGISCNRIFTMKNPYFAKLLKTRGMTPSSQILCEYSSYLIITTLTLALASAVFGIAIEYVNIDAPELIGVRVIDCIIFLIKIAPVIIMITLMQTAIYELIPNTIGAVLTQFVITIVLGYFSGCFYPNYFFPELIQNISYCLPIGAGFSYIRKIMSGSFPYIESCMTTFYIFVFAVITLRTRNHKIMGDIK